MSASISDKIVASENGGNPQPTTVSSSRSIDGTSLSCVALTDWPTATAVHLITYQKKADGTMDRDTLCLWKGIVSGTTIGTLTLKGGTDAGNAVGDFVEMAPTSSMWQDLYDGLTQTLNVDGTLKSNIVTTAKINDGATTTAKIADAAVTNAKLSTSSGEIGAVWAAWTPTVTASAGSGYTASGSGRYTQIGKTIHFAASIVFSVVGTASSPVLTLPVAASSSAKIGIGVGREDAMTGNMCFVKISDTTHASIGRYDNGNILSGGNGSTLQCWGSYEAAQ